MLHKQINENPCHLAWVILHPSLALYYVSTREEGLSDQLIEEEEVEVQKAGAQQEMLVLRLGFPRVQLYIAFQLKVDCGQ